MQSSELLTWWTHSAAKGIRAEAISVLLALALTLNGGAALIQALRPLPAYISPPGGPGVSLPGVLSPTSALDFAERCLKARHRFFPASFREAQAEAEPCFHPQMQESFRKKVEGEAVVVKEQRRSHQLFVTDRKVLQRPSATSAVVRLEGLRTVWMGADELYEEAFHAVVTVALWQTSEGPRGLTFTSWAESPALASAVKR